MPYAMSPRLERFSHMSAPVLRFGTERGATSRQSSEKVEAKIIHKVIQTFVVNTCVQLLGKIIGSLVERPKGLDWKTAIQGLRVHLAHSN